MVVVLQVWSTKDLQKTRRKQHNVNAASFGRSISPLLMIRV